MRSGNTIIVSRLSISEVFSAFNRRRRELSFNVIDYQKVARDFTNLCEYEYQIIEIDEEITRKSRELLEKYPLRASDSIQLASALLTNEILKQDGYPERIFLASDLKLLGAADGETLQNDDPQNHP